MFAPPPVPSPPPAVWGRLVDAGAEEAPAPGIEAVVFSPLERLLRVHLNCGCVAAISYKGLEAAPKNNEAMFADLVRSHRCPTTSPAELPE